MADGAFPSLVSADRNVNAATNPIFVQLTDGTTVIGVTSNALDVNIASGSLSVNSEYAEDSVHSTGDTGSFVLSVRNDTLASLVSADGDYAPFQVNARGALYVELDPTNDVTIADGGNSITVDGTVAATQSGTWTVDLGATDNAVLDAIAASLVDIETNTDYGAVVGGGVEAAALRVTIANDSTGVLSVDDNGTSLTVDASQLDIDDLNLTDDAVRISGNTAANTETNPIFVQNVDTAISGEEVHDYDTAAAVASDASDNHDYTVAGTTFHLTSVIVSGSGNVKFEIQTGPVASLATVAVGFLTGRQGDTKQIDFKPAVEVPVTSTGTVRIIRTNRQGAATDLYSTIIGYDV